MAAPRSRGGRFGRSLAGFATVGIVVVALAALGVWLIHHVKTSPNRAAYAGMMLLFGSFLRVDPPPQPRAERIVKDEEDQQAAEAGPSPCT